MEFMGLSVNGVAELVLGIIATFVSLVMFLLPMPTVGRVWKTIDVGDIQPYPYMAANVNCMLWYSYFLSRKQQVAPFKYECLFNSSSIGYAIEGFYFMTFAIFSYLTNTLKWYTALAITIVSSFFFLIMAFPSSWLEYLAGEDRNKIIGPIIILTGIVMYITPLISIVHTYKKKHVESLPFWQCITLGLYGFTWMIYALLPPRFDIYFTVVNGIGVVLSVVQLRMCYSLLEKFQKISASDVDEEKLVSSDGYGGLEQQVLN